MSTNAWAFHLHPASLGLVVAAAAGCAVLALRHRGAGVTTINPDSASTRAMGLNLMDPGPRERVIAAGYAQGTALVRGARRAA